MAGMASTSPRASQSKYLSNSSSPSSGTNCKLDIVKALLAKEFAARHLGEATT